jgi:signal peptidase I
MKDITRKQYIKFGIVATIYLLWVIWLNNYWWLFGLPVIFDMYLTKKVNWSFWKKRNKKNNTIVEWIDALIFALIAVTVINIFLFQNFNIPTSSMEKSLLVGDYLFVSKVNYGPRVPNTPLSFPLVQHTMPMSKDKKSYLTWIQNDYRRLAGTGQIKRNDPVVFNYPEGDTVCTAFQSNASYYYLVKQAGSRERVWNDKNTFGRIVYRPVDKRENFIKRCVGIPGDTLEVRHNQLYVNGSVQELVPKLQFNYRVVTNGTQINKKKLEDLGISNEDIDGAFMNGVYRLPLTEENAKLLKELPNVLEIEKEEMQAGYWDGSAFPFSENYKWNRDNYGPIGIPKKGVTIELNTGNLPLYERLISVYENNEIVVDGENIKINGEVVQTYTFKMDYYWMMGDNRHNSADSRFWGFVPEDHIVGKPLFIYFSLNKDKRFPANIRFNRMFKKIR